MDKRRRGSERKAGVSSKYRILCLTKEKIFQRREKQSIFCQICDFEQRLLRICLLFPATATSDMPSGTMKFAKTRLEHNDRDPGHGKWEMTGSAEESEFPTE
ncbi:hypothetical protein SUGI_1076710 [Cryptomeria japonica]|nr:hypothetical protein SUGI_1076710 [Cryptomeria japonica]